MPVNPPRTEPLNHAVPIVDRDGKPTPEFIRKWQNLLSSVGKIVQNLLNALTTAHGALLFRGDTDWEPLAPGADGYQLTTHGADADPTWEPPYTDERVDDRVASLLVAGSNITVTYDDGADTITIDASDGGSVLVVGPTLSDFVPHTGATFTAALVGLQAVMVTRSGNISDILAYATAAAGSAQVKPCIYTDNGGAPGALVASGSEVTGVAAGINTFPLSSPYSVTAGTILWIGLGVRTANISMAASASVQLAYQGSYTGTLPNPITPSYTTASWGTFWYKLTTT